MRDLLSVGVECEDRLEVAGLAVGGVVVVGVFLPVAGELLDDGSFAGAGRAEHDDLDGFRVDLPVADAALTLLEGSAVGAARRRGDFPHECPQIRSRRHL